MSQMPSEIRDLLHAKQHPALAVECTHCGAHEHKPCTTPSKRRRLDVPHHSRQVAAGLVAEPETEAS